MGSNMIIRSCRSSVRTLISHHLRPTVAASNIQTEPLVNNIYNWQYLLPDSFLLQPVNSGYGFGRDVAGYSMLEELARARQKFEAVNTNFDDDNTDSDVDDDDDDDDDADDYGSGDDDYLGTDDD